MRSMRRVVRRAFRAALAVGLLLGLMEFGRSPWPAPESSDQTLFESGGLKIYRGISRQGTPILVLTNVDDEGNLLPGWVREVPERESAEIPVDRQPDRPAARGPGIAPTLEPRSSAGVKVLVKGGADPGAIDERDVEVQSDDRHGTTVIININPPAASERGPLIVPAVAVPVVSYGGLVGPFHYPERQPFLGYGLGNNSPVFFGGLGLSSTERYARVADQPCTSATACPKDPGAAAP